MFGLSSLVLWTHGKASDATSERTIRDKVPTVKLLIRPTPPVEEGFAHGCGRPCLTRRHSRTYKLICVVQTGAMEESDAGAWCEKLTKPGGLPRSALLCLIFAAFQTLPSMAYLLTLGWLRRSMCMACMAVGQNQDTFG